MNNYEKYFGSPERAAISLEMLYTYLKESGSSQLDCRSLHDCMCDAFGFPEDVPFVGHHILDWMNDEPARYENEMWIRGNCND